MEIISTAKADNTAAAGAHGAEINRGAPPSGEESRPVAIAPKMPASTPLATKSLPSAAYAATPKAIEDGRATSIAAKPPHKSPAIGLETFVRLSTTQSNRSRASHRVFKIRTRAKCLSFPGTTVQGANSVLVWATISLIASL